MKNFKNFALFQKIKTRIKKFDLEKHLVKKIIGIFVVSFVISIIGGTSTLVSSVSLPLITVIFAFLSYKYNKEKFRLELFEKRLEVYENINAFCSVVIKYGDLPKLGEPEDKDYEQINQDCIKYQNAADLSFRRRGYHLSKLLFSDKLNNYLKELNDSYCFLLTYKDGERNSETAQKWGNHLKAIIHINQNLPEIFKPYLYFGGYRND